MKTTLRWLLLAVLLALAACGNKGPLVMPDKTPPAKAASPAASPASDSLDSPASPPG